MANHRGSDLIDHHRDPHNLTLLPTSLDWNEPNPRFHNKNNKTQGGIKINQRQRARKNSFKMQVAAEKLSPTSSNALRSANSATTTFQAH
ncbi:hypothetical protein EUGRSUZ_K00569 [Eucalyptus grandis]|uniref:Uncharacterized protein n=2 Tax=Eucalyptus grandis TaxID=71139 RepID=A0ACC3ISU9_EUCGR|nr:hypothetical protein EUGRSUZ_K00569 [Eucalyptus grandis]